MFARAFSCGAGLAALLSCSALAQDGESLFKTHCAICHEGASTQAPGREVLRQLTAEKILQTLETGTMKTIAAERSRSQRRILAEYLSGKTLGGNSELIPASASCKAGTAPFGTQLSGPGWNGWGIGLTNTRFQGKDAARLEASDLPLLRLKWAFGLPGASSGGTQPVVAGGRVYVGSAEGDLFALDAKTGCLHWRIEAEAGIRAALVVGPHGSGRLAGYFGDQVANVYAIDLETGKTLWKVKADNHPQASITAAVQLHEGRLYVPMSSREGSKPADPRYPCCEFRGSIMALDANTGRQIWKTMVIEETPSPRERNSVGTMIMGPSGAAVWNAPTIDVGRRAVYFNTGNNYSPPATEHSDAVMAVEMDTGRIKWARQQTKGDVWNAGCRSAVPEPASCPNADAPDYDFASSVVLARTKAGRDVLVAGNKSGIVWAINPDSGRLLWERQVGKGSSRGGVLWGLAVDGERVYVPNGYFDATNPDQSGGMAALDLASGRMIWNAANPPCGDRKPCQPTHNAAVTAIPGVVFSGTMDGQLYAYASESGAILWQYNTVQQFKSVNGVPAKGGSMSNSGPTVADGMMFVQSGYSHHSAQLPGNVLLAFSKE